MNRTYIAVIEARGKEMARSKPMGHKEALAWIDDQKKRWPHILRGGYLISYLLTMSQPEIKIERDKSESEHEKTLNKYL
jgi:hypothetical protein